MRRSLIMAVLFLAGLGPAEGAIRAGLASRVITPREPMWAAGYAARNALSLRKRLDDALPQRGRAPG